MNNNWINKSWSWKKLSDYKIKINWIIKNMSWYNQLTKWLFKSFKFDDIILELLKWLKKWVIITDNLSKNEINELYLTKYSTFSSITITNTYDKFSNFIKYYWNWKNLKVAIKEILAVSKMYNNNWYKQIIEFLEKNKKYYDNFIKLDNNLHVIAWILSREWWRFNDNLELI